MTLEARRAILVVAALAVLCVAAYWFYASTPAAPPVTFVSLTGERLPTAELRGRVVLVNFWATDCAVCVKEMPRLVRTFEKYRPRGLELIAVAMRHDPPNYVLGYVEKNRLPFKVALDPLGDLAKAFGDVRLTPTLIVIDRRGNVVRRIVGEPDFAELESLIEAKLNEPT